MQVVWYAHKVICYPWVCTTIKPRYILIWVSEVLAQNRVAMQGPSEATRRIREVIVASAYAPEDNTQISPQLVVRLVRYCKEKALKRTFTIRFGEAAQLI